MLFNLVPSRHDITDQDISRLAPAIEVQVGRKPDFKVLRYVYDLDKLAELLVKTRLGKLELSEIRPYMFRRLDTTFNY